jgi:DNA-binding transcriptional MerR regulator
MKEVLQKHLGSRKAMNKELFNALMEKKYTVKDLSDLNSKITYRTINHWDEKGYLLTKSNSDGWRKFSFTEYIWILFLDELREFDIAVKNIIPSLLIDFGFAPIVIANMTTSERENLLKLDFKVLLEEIDHQHALENFCLMLVDIVSYTTPLTLRFFKDGSSFFIYGNPAYHGLRFLPAIEQYNKALIESNFKSSISISIDSLIMDFIINKDLDNISESMILTKPELEVLKQLQNGELQEMTIFFDKGKPHKIVLTDKVKIADATKRVKEHFFAPYQRCEFITEDGKSHFIKRTTFKKL